MDRPLGVDHRHTNLESVSGQAAGDGPQVVSKRKKPDSSSDIRAECGAQGDIRSTTMSFRDMYRHGPLLAKYLETRKAIFIDRLKWGVAEVDGMEFDQYDTPACRWVVLHRADEVLGGVRLLPTNARCGIYSYMLRDAQRGILKDLPTDVLYDTAPVDPQVWEASRFFVSDKVEAARRLTVQAELFGMMVSTAEAGGASHILGIVPSIWARWSRRLGVCAVPAGGKFQTDGTVSQSVMFDIRNPIP